MQTVFPGTRVQWERQSLNRLAILGPGQTTAANTMFTTLASNLGSEFSTCPSLVTAFCLSARTICCYLLLGLPSNLLHLTDTRTILYPSSLINSEVIIYFGPTVYHIVVEGPTSNPLIFKLRTLGSLAVSLYPYGQ